MQTRVKIIIVSKYNIKVFIFHTVFNLVEYKNQCLGKIAMQKYSSTDAIPDMFIKVKLIK